MTPTEFLAGFLDPCLKWLASNSGPPVTDAARTMLLCISMQESGPNLDARYQSYPATEPGPARGLWQFEQGGGVAGVLSHPATCDVVKHACGLLMVRPEPAACWRTIEGNDRLAVTFARMLLYSDPYPVPTTEQDAWDCYMRLWRPGKPHPETWPSNWQAAQAAVQASPLPK